MKAYILAGGVGTRLYPLSVRKPKPMVRLFDRPLLEHLICLLTEHGFREICLTLQYLPSAVTEWFGDGSAFGCSLEYRIEEKPLGTAGSIAACLDFAADETALIIGGDVVCDADLSAFLRFHREKRASVSILGKKCEELSEYGLILSDDRGRICGFIEKPSADRLYSELVNTGIYLIEPEILRLIPPNTPYDFGAQLFPALLQAGRGLFVCEHGGYWNDVGSCERLMQTARAVLDGTLTLHIPPSAVALPHCWVSPDADLDPSAVLLPYSVVGSDTHIGKNTVIEGSILDGASVASDCRITGSILAPQTQIGSSCHVSAGCVLADGVSIGSGSYVSPFVCIPPDLRFPVGSLIGSETVNAPLSALRFDACSTLTGHAEELTPALMLRMGRSASEFLRCGASACGNAASLLAEAFLCGCASVGCACFALDSSCPAEAAFAASAYGLQLTLFVRQEGNRIRLHFYDGDGLPLCRSAQRRLEAALSGGVKRAPQTRQMPPLPVLGTAEAHAAAAARSVSLHDLRVAAEDKRLQKAFSMAGVGTEPPSDGIIAFRLSEDGFTLEATDEEGCVHSHEKLLCALLLTELERGSRCLALPYSAPVAADALAAALGGTLYRLNRDGVEALALWRKKPYARDGLFLALRLCHAITRRKERLSSLLRRVPRFETSEAILTPRKPTARLMNLLRREYSGETVSGFRFRTEKGCATVSADTLGRLRIFAESSAFEAADELCGEICDRLRELDE